jgi:hypothetical protein
MNYSGSDLVIKFRMRTLLDPQHRARIFKRLRSPGFDSKESITPAYGAWRAAIRQIGLSSRSARLGIDSRAP